VLIVVGDIFAGLSNLDVAAVGHVTAMTVAVIGGSLLAWQRWRRRRPLVADPAAAVSAGQQG
jgi:membrane associated rhomboid family serine protease